VSTGQKKILVEGLEAVKLRRFDGRTVDMAKCLLLQTSLETISSGAIINE